MKNTGIVYHSTERTPTVLAELAGLLPPLSGEQLAALEADLLQNGCYSPVIVNEELVIVDGHNRQSLCEKHGIPYNMAVFAFDDLLEAKQWALDTQKGRRNLDKWELGKIALKLKPEIEAKAKANMSAGGQAYHPSEEGSATLPNLPPVDTRKELADSVGLGERTMGKVMQIDEHAPAAVKEALDKKELSIHQGYQITKQVENLPEEQREQAALEAVELPQLGCVVHGRAFQASREDASPLAGFSAPQDGTIHLMVLHGQVDGAGDYAPISREDIAASGLTYLALGHVHQCSGVQREGNTFWAYPGCPEGSGFDETGEKGVLCLTLDENSCQEELVPLSRRRYEKLTVDLTDWESPLEALRAVLPPDTDNDVYRITFTGERGESPLDLTTLETVLAPRFYGLTLRDRTRVRREVWARREEDSLTGLFLRSMAARCQADLEDETLQLAVRFGLAALERGEDVAP